MGNIMPGECTAGDRVYKASDGWTLESVKAVGEKQEVKIYNRNIIRPLVLTLDDKAAIQFVKCLTKRVSETGGL